MSDHPCSRCPLLDLGHVYPVGDERDPWRRMPELFQRCHRLFGGAMMNRQGRTRLRIERLLGHWCKVTREKHGLCTRRRSLICRHVLAEALDAARGADGPERYAIVQARLKAAANDDAVYQRLKATRVEAKPGGPMTLPPITFRTAA